MKVKTMTSKDFQANLFEALDVIENDDVLIVNQRQGKGVAILHLDYLEDLVDIRDASRRASESERDFEDLVTKLRRQKNI